jgi:hypothetical protein
MAKYHTKEFYDIVHMGSCDPSCTEAKILKLHRLLERCISQVSRLQQPPHSISEEEAKAAEKEYKYGWINVKGMVADIAMGLTGETIYFKSDLVEKGIIVDGQVKERECKCDDSCDKKESADMANKLEEKVKSLLRREDVRKGIRYLEEVVREAKKNFE